MKLSRIKTQGFSLIELLVTLAIIAVLAAVSLFGTQGVREQGRDGKRKSDIETIRSGLEIFKSDCNIYPASLTFGGSLNGTGSPPSCAGANQYMAKVPDDPQAPARRYYYSRGATQRTYILCARLEQAPNPAMDVSGCGGNCNGTCNYKVVSP